MTELQAKGHVAGRASFAGAQAAPILLEFTDRLYRATEVQQIYQAALDAITAAMGCTRTAVLLMDEDRIMRFVAWNELSDTYRAAVEGHTPWSWDEPNPTPVYVSDVERSDLAPALRDIVLGERIRSLCFIPLMAGGRLIGKFMAYHDTAEGFDPPAREVGLAIARQLAFSIERFSSEQKRKDAERALTEAQRHKDEFLVTLAHELRNPLGAITLALDVLDHPKAGQQSILNSRKAIRRQTTHLKRLVDDLLDITRIAQGKLDLRIETVDLGKVVNTAVELALGSIKQKRQSIEVTAPKHAVKIAADAARMCQVLANLIGNASKYSDTESVIKVEIRQLPSAVELIVSDDGIGIAPDFLPRIFDLYSQEHQARWRAQGGLGIGLSLVKRLVTMQGGTIEACSEGAGKGSTFTVRLPTL